MTYTIHEAPFVRGGEGWKQAAHRLADELAAARVNSRANTALLDAASAALEHLQELRDAWQRGVIDERDGKGGTRSNRNVSVEVALRKALTAEHDTRLHPRP
jgi:hypothetical protein